MASDAFIGLPEPFNSMIVFKNIGFYLHGALWKIPEGQDISLSLEWKTHATDMAPIEVNGVMMVRKTTRPDVWRSYRETRYRRAYRKAGKWSIEEHGAYEPCSGLATISVNGIEIPRKMDIACMWDMEVTP